MQYAKFREVKPQYIQPRGHLLAALEQQRAGLSGHYAEQGYPFDTPMWDGGVGKVVFSTPAYESIPTEGSGYDAWWPYEQSAYLLDGLLRLGILTGDQEKIELFRQNLDYVLAHPEADGRLGHAYSPNRSEWPMAVFFRAAMVYYEYSGDERVKTAFHRHFASLDVETLATQFRNITNLEGVLKLCEWTGDTALLDKALAAYRRHDEYNQLHYDDESELHWSRLTSGKNFVMHGVSFCEELKLPVLLAMHTGDAAYLDGATAGLADVLRRHEQLPGLPSSNEYFSGRDPLQGYEVCVVSDFLWSLGYFLMATGDAAYADRLEKVAYNALPGAVLADYSALQYLSAPNQVTATPESNHTGFFYGVSPWRQYRANHFPQCCPGNAHRALPNFILRMWMQTPDGAPVAALYGPSQLRWNYRGQEITITEETAYPCDEAIRFDFHTAAPLTMPFVLRVPRWCRHATLRINGAVAELTPDAGGYATIERCWHDGDRVELCLAMIPEVHAERNWRWVEWGTLLFSYPVPEFRNRSGHGAIANYELRPAGPWNYALAADPKLEVVKNADGSVALRCDAFEVTGYDALDRERFTPAVPLFARPRGPVERLTLVPFGTTTLRITAFADGRERRLLPVFEITAWGGFPYDYRRPLAEQSFLPEQLSAADFRARATAVQPETSGYCNLQHHFGPGSNRLAYLQFRVWAAEAGEAVFALGASQGAECFLDGRRCFELEPISGAELFAPQWFRATVRPGYNDLLVKVAEGYTPSQYRKAWGAHLTVFFEN